MLTRDGEDLLGGDRDNQVSDADAYDEEVTGSIGKGLCVLVGVTHEDDAAVARKLADKVMNLRIMPDEKSVLDVGGEVLVVSQFTLYGNTAKGRRPSWVDAARPEHAEPLIEQVMEHLRDAGLTVASGRFRRYMQVELVNDGPTTLLIDV